MLLDFINRRALLGLLAMLSLLLIPLPGDSAAISNINIEVEKCRQIHQHDPQVSDPLEAHELGDNERAFLDCVYAGIRKSLMPQSVIPEEYETLISSHRQMTDAVENGELTREQRQQRTQQMIDQIKDNENAEIERRIRELSIKRDRFLRERERMLKRKPWLF